MEFNIEREMLDITEMSEPNPSWHYICLGCGADISIFNMPRGKFVKWKYSSDDYEVVKFPGLSYHCKICWARVPSDEVSKSVRPSIVRQYMPGLVKWSLELELLDSVDNGEYSLIFEPAGWGRLVGQAFFELREVTDVVGDYVVYCYHVYGAGELKRLHGWQLGLSVTIK